MKKSLLRNGSCETLATANSAPLEAVCPAARRDGGQLAAAGGVGMAGAELFHTLSEAEDPRSSDPVSRSPASGVDRAVPSRWSWPCWSSLKFRR